jgi:hypothetical protein
MTGWWVGDPSLEGPPWRPFSVEFRVIRIISRVPGYTVVFGWVFVGFWSKKRFFWVILGVLEVIFWSTSAVYPSWSGEEVIWGLFLGPFWVIWESPRCKDP